MPLDLFSKGNKDSNLTIAEYLQHMGRAFAIASLAGPAVIQEVLKDNLLDAEIPLGDQTVPMDGATMVPEGFFDLDEFEIECESAVEPAIDADGNVEGLALTMSRGVLSRKMHVKFKAKFVRNGKVESVEIMRDAGNNLLRRDIEKANIRSRNKED